MDRRVKERLIGATVLVVLIVSIVPELLSGPKARRPPAAPSAAAASAVDPVRNVTVDLATSKATPEDGGQASGASSAVAGASASTVDAAEAASSADSVAAPAADVRATTPPTISTLRAQQAAPETPPAAVKPEPPPVRSATSASKPAVVAATPTAAAHRAWSVQLGSFSRRVNADQLARRVKVHDASVYVSPAGHGGSLRYRVRLGPFQDRGAAERAAGKLRREGFPSSVIPPA